MDFLDVIKTRRSVKAFDKDHAMSDEEVRQLLELTALSPSSFNMQNWHFVVVRDGETKAALEGAAFRQQQVGSASAVIVITGDLTAQDNTARTLRHLEEPTHSNLAGMVQGFYGDNPELLRDEACRSAGIAGMALMLAAVNMGYMSCPMIGYDPAKVAEILELPATHPPLLMVPIGKPTAPVRPRMGLLDLEELVSMERFGEHTLRGAVPE